MGEKKGGERRVYDRLVDVKVDYVSFFFTDGKAVVIPDKSDSEGIETSARSIGHSPKQERTSPASCCHSLRVGTKHPTKYCLTLPGGNCETWLLMAVDGG